MTTPAAIQAAYADYRRIKGRKVLQLILEVPLEQAPLVHDAFGEPLPDGSTWVAVARIDPTAKPERKGGKLAQKAGILCNEGAFITFLKETYPNILAEYENDAALVVRFLCMVESRVDLDHDVDAAHRFKALATEYEAWKLAA